MYNVNLEHCLIKSIHVHQTTEGEIPGCRADAQLLVGLAEKLQGTREISKVLREGQKREKRNGTSGQFTESSVRKIRLLSKVKIRTQISGVVYVQIGRDLSILVSL